MPNTWKSTEPHDGFHNLFELIQKKTDEDKEELKQYIDNQFRKIAPAWQMAIANRTHSIINSVLIAILFLLVASFLTGC